MSMSNRRSNWVRLGPVSIRIGSRHLASWGYPRIAIGGLSIWSRMNTGQRILVSYHPRRSVTWVFSLQGSMWLKPRRPHWHKSRRSFSASFGFFGFMLSWQAPMWRKP